MPFVPSTVRSLIRTISGRVVARSSLTDLSPGSVLLALVTAVAEEFAGAQIQIKRVRDSFYLQGVSGALLDERLAELPPDGLRRLGPVAASGPVMVFTRDPATVGDPFTLPAGSTMRRTDDAVPLYRLVEDVVFLAGQANNAADPARVVCTVPGERGNCDTGTIRKIDNLPPEIVRVDNVAGLYNGTNAETDGQARSRALAYLGSLARSQPSALRFLALSFLSTDQVRARYAFIWEDARRPGYTEVVIDDGTGGAGGTRAGATVTGTVPESGALLIFHEKPATRAISKITVVRGANTLVFTQAAGDYLSIPERGVVEFAEGVLESGDAWTIDKHTDGSQYQVYTGLVAELQDRIEGDPSDPAARPGWRAAGTRVRVVPATVEFIGFDVSIIPESGTALGDLTEAVKAEAVRFLQSLAPGDTLFVSQLIEHLMGVDGLVSVTLYTSGGSTPFSDQVPSSRRKALRSTVDRVVVRPEPEES